MIIDIVATIISNILLFFLTTVSINKTNANKIHSLSNRNKPKSVRREKENMGSAKSKDIVRSTTIDTTLVLKP